VKFGLARLAMAFTPSAGALDVARDVRPWLGDEAAVALLAGAGRPQPLLVAAVRDRERAEAMLERLGAAPSGRHNGAPASAPTGARRLRGRPPRDRP
jgi:hypothetical protein